jgi:hypothetical protein
MTDKEIMKQVVFLLSTIQANEEARALHIKVTEERLALMNKWIALLADIVRAGPSPERDEQLKMLSNAIKPGESQQQIAKAIAKVESGHEHLGFLIEKMRAEIERLE